MLEVCPATVTVTAAMPVDSAGLTAVHEVAEAQLTPVAAVAPKSTVVEPEVVENPLPVIVTNVPPAVGPDFGLRPVTEGAAVLDP